MQLPFFKGKVEAYRKKARANADRGRFQDVIADLEPLLSRRTNTSDDKRYSELFYLLGVAYCETDNHNQAIHFLNTSLRLAREAHNNWLEAASLNGLAITYYRDGQMDEAYRYCNEALHAPGVSPRDVVNMKHTMAVISIDRGELDRAEQILHEVIDEATLRLDSTAIAKALNELARTAEQSGDPTLALKHYCNSLSFRSVTGDIPGIEITIANALVLLEKYPELRNDEASLPLIETLGLNYQDHCQN
jgi:tetratricopeptide (TPR) repeat protein